MPSKAYRRIIDTISYVEIMVVYHLWNTFYFPRVLLSSVPIRSEISYMELFPPVPLGYFVEIFFLTMIYFSIYSINIFILKVTPRSH